MLSYRSAARPKDEAPHVCPYCQQKLGAVRYGVRWTRIQVGILDLLDRMPAGMTARELAGAIYNDESKWHRIVEHIYMMRDKLLDTTWQISRPMGMKYGRYVLGRRG
jgi:uncharacterized protein YbaR (Trm112 family)